MTLLDEVSAAGRRLVGAGLRPKDAARDAEVLARHALGWDLATYLCRRQEPAPARFESRYRSLVRRRAEREPVSCITGRREFWGLSFEVGPAVLTPRPETELLIEEALAVVANRNAALWIVDVGTGSGCLAIALALELPAARVTAIDVSSAALDVARRNADAHGVSARITWTQASYLDGLASGAPARADMIVANLPYVPSAAITVLSPEVKDHEPLVALDGGRDGLDPLRALIGDVAAYLTAGGHLVVEFGAGQEDAVRALLATTPDLQLLSVAGDLSGIPRAAVIRRH